MPANSIVSLHYGPYDSCGVVEYKTERLEGLQTVLEKHGHQVQLEKIKDRKAVELWVNGECIFKCKMTDLDFGGDGQLDPLCEDALQKVEKAF